MNLFQWLKLGRLLKRARKEIDMDSKGWLQSKTIQGIIIGIAPLIAGFFGKHVSIGETDLAPIFQGLGALWALIGRFTAKAPVSPAPIKNLGGAPLG